MAIFTISACAAHPDAGKSVEDSDLNQGKKEHKVGRINVRFANIENLEFNKDSNVSIPIKLKGEYNYAGADCDADINHKEITDSGASVIDTNFSYTNEEATFLVTLSFNSVAGDYLLKVGCRLPTGEANLTGGVKLNKSYSLTAN